MKLQTNIFPITNLREFKLLYRLVRVSGLRPDQPDYFQNRRHLEKHLSYLLRQPVLAIERDGAPHLAVPHDVHAMPAEIQLVRLIVQLQVLETPYEIDLSHLSLDAAPIALRFVRFMLQAPLSRDDRLWQPAAGRPFFIREPVSAKNGVAKYGGLKIRPVLIPEGMALCVDTSACYVSATSLPAALTHDEFVRRWKNIHAVYHFGHRWYEIQLRARADRTVADYAFVIDGQRWTLLDFIRDRTARPVPSDLANLAADGTVVTYVDNRGTEKGVPAGLCYPVIDTSREAVGRQHGDTILAPGERRQLTIDLTAKYLQELRFGTKTLQVSDRPYEREERVFALPDLRFGNGFVLRAQDDVSNFSKRRSQLLRERSVGSYTKGPFDRQYIFLPRSIADSCGPQFLSALKGSVAEIIGPEAPYEPQVVAYDDACKRTFAQQGQAIRAAIAACRMPGYALVMIHRTSDRHHRDEDQLAAMVTRELFEQDIHAAVIHSETVAKSYRERRTDGGRLEYELDPAARSKFSGYVRNVALTKILLTNQKWPFLLESKLHSPITIGIDVKLNTCGLLTVADYGRTIRSELRTSQQRERLRAAQMTKYIVELVQSLSTSGPLDGLVIHRDGRAFASELAGIQTALVKLRQQGLITQDCRWAVLQISKSAPAPFRMYRLTDDGTRTLTVNPRLGTFFMASASEAYICCTGAPLLRTGTANPLHVEMVAGNADFEHCLEDLYWLSALTWTQPDGCTRNPITVTLNDRVLVDRVSAYNSDELDFEPGADEDSDEEVA